MAITEVKVTSGCTTHTRYDFTGAAEGDGLRIGAQMFKLVDVRHGSKNVDGVFVDTLEFALEGMCLECGATWQQRFTSLARGATVRRRCDACRAGGRMWRGAENASRAVKRGVKFIDDVPEKPKRNKVIPEVYSVNLEAQTEGNFVRYRGRDYQVLRVVGYLRTNGAPHDRLDLVGTCAVCGKTFPHRAEDDDTRLPLRCRPCRKETGRAWRYGD